MFHINDKEPIILDEACRLYEKYEARENDSEYEAFRKRSSIKAVMID